MLTKCLDGENFELCFRVAPKSICGPLHWSKFRKKLRTDSEPGCGCLLLSKTRKHPEKLKKTTTYWKSRNTTYLNIAKWGPGFSV